MEEQFNRVLERLDGVKKLSDGSYMALCPCHDDRKPSLHISLLKGKLVAYCFGCGARTKDVLSALGVGWPESRIAVATYDYTDENGQLLFQKIRFEPKSFLLRRPLDSGGFAYDLKGVRRVLYNLPEILKADRVYIVEGEKDADRLNREGFVATTNYDGAGKWDPNYTEALRGKEIVIVPDNDEAGKRHAELVALSVLQVAKSLKIVELPGLKAGEDISDFLVLHSTEDFLKVVEETSNWSPLPSREADVEIAGSTGKVEFRDLGVTLLARRLKLHSDGKLTALLSIRVGALKLPVSGLINLAAPQTRRAYAKGLESMVSLPWHDILETAYTKLSEFLLEGEPIRRPELSPNKVRNPSFLIQGFLPARMECLLWGKGGLGKSWLALAVAHHLATGEPFLGRKVLQTGSTLYLDWETDLTEIERRLSKMLPGEDRADFLFYKEMRVPILDSIEYLQEIVSEIDPILIIVDSLGRALSGGLLDEGIVSSFYSAIRTLGRSILIIHHPRKESNQYYGNSYIMWNARMSWELDAKASLEDGTVHGILQNDKSNISRKQPPLPFRMTIEPFELTSLSLQEYKGGFSLSERIEVELARRGKMSTKDISEELETSIDVVRVTLRRMRAKGQVEKDEEGFWYLPVEIPF